MSLSYGFVKAKINGAPVLKAKPLGHETQYHLHVPLDVAGAAWDVAIVQALQATQAGRCDLIDKNALPALDFTRSDVLAETGRGA
ncbi:MULTISPECIES: hypothetical protein [Mesorhizobium]|uniref:Uncharacterized protein n=2 Tax=Mesorhizobium TaxID=68287 RepID=A0ABU4Z6V2_9HYPH|nr:MULTISPECIES: hypothetical protein [Mesorhizobium]MDX8437744.1 hypothetical protein [Mesorhizobium abyssinicae]MDX8456433.1 hypothetical protein [Mesorhizobium sp. VK9D]MDX8481614.1 hypothetical protein [Mesorhizobium sp. VK24D]MDX8494703.1 hypothetical protein [Mesorhizobium sp. VK22B]MDX8515881.1 hypothetical protein [Mesorhizobium sp. VK23E]